MLGLTTLGLFHTAVSLIALGAVLVLLVLPVIGLVTQLRWLCASSQRGAPLGARSPAR